MKFRPIRQLNKLVRGVRALFGRPAAPSTRQQPPRFQPTLDLDALRADYVASGLASEPDRFVLYRIIGNDLPPRHRKGSARANLHFILKHEPELADCEKRWIVNRIIDRAEERAIIDLLERRGQAYLHIPFDLDEYARIGWDLDGFPERGALLNLSMQRKKAHKPRYLIQTCISKNNYAMNNNGARNAALLAGRAAAKWVLPWDGNCFVTEAAWAELRAAVLAQPYVKYFVVPMARIPSNRALLDPACRPVATDEPQILFRRDAALMFDPAFPYGMSPKVELLLRLGVPGPWDQWPVGKAHHANDKYFPDRNSFLYAGWVARLESGRRRQEIGEDAMRRRKRARDIGIIETLNALDRKVMSARLHRDRPIFYPAASLDRVREAGVGDPWRDVATRLVADAHVAMTRGLHAVTDKTTRAPSGDPHDYWHPAPFWWPNPQTPDGLPYVDRDGERRPDTILHAPGSEQFDRSRLQHVLEDTALCAAAWRVTGQKAFALHGAALLRRWFLASATRMNPHLRYAQVRLGWNDNLGTGSGIVEMRDLPLLLDGARLLVQAQALGRREAAKFQTWIAAYGAWLRDDPQGVAACLTPNNIGTFYDLQAAAIAVYLGDAGALNEIFRRCRERIQLQFDPDGSQPLELERRDALHYCCFNLQAWSTLARIAESCGEDLWAYRSAAGHSLRHGLDWLLAFEATRTWPHGQIDAFDWNRLAPLRRERDRLDGRTDSAPPPAALQSFPAETGIRPYWFL
ncbi:MAG TPA: alginate lyase family protein [Dongiaceae bacterium]|nr:alginate lyase family protein [Dongiaceae bacterium]